MLHKEILSPAQQALLPLIKNLGPRFSLCGGTGLALHIGHRESIDFDLFTQDELNTGALRKKFAEADKNFSVLVKSEDEYTVLVKGVKVTCLRYPFPFASAAMLDNIVGLPDILTLSAMKAYALGRRSKWKDYVDLYFVFSVHHTLREVVERAQAMFGNEFNEKVFRAALAYYADIDYSEAVAFRPGYAVDDDRIRSVLQEFSVGE